MENTNTNKNKTEKAPQENILADSIYEESSEDMHQQSFNGMSHEDEDPEAPNKSARKWVLFIIIIVIAGGIFMKLNKVNDDVKDNNENKAKENAPVSESWPTSAGAYEVQIGDQEAGNNIKIDSLTFPQDGWLVIYTNENDQPKHIVSAYRFGEGTVENFDMGLITNLESATKYHAVIFSDNGDKVFNYTEDQRILGEGGKVMSVSFETK
ncbi:MAG: hypothetical protein ABIH48_00695 [Candidatus Falkowbacteria bacterium]